MEGDNGSFKKSNMDGKSNASINLKDAEVNLDKDLESQSGDLPNKVAHKKPLAITLKSEKNDVADQINDGQSGNDHIKIIDNPDDTICSHSKRLELIEPINVNEIKSVTQPVNLRDEIYFNDTHVTAGEEPSTSCNVVSFTDYPEVIEASPEISDTTGSPKSFLEEVTPEASPPTHFPESMPCINCPEKIILIIDSALDENCTHFKVLGEAWDPLRALKICIITFIRMKHAINPKHSFAIIVLTESNAFWMCDFTSDINKLIMQIDSIQPVDSEDIFDLNLMFNMIFDKIEIPEEDLSNSIMISPPFVVRAILFYGRSYTLLEIERTREVELILDSVYFTLDVLMTHEPVDSANNCSKIFSTLMKLDKKGYSYFLSVGRNFVSLQEAMAKLLCHLLQRPLQTLADYTIEM